MANTLEEKNKAASNDFNTRVVECRISAKILAKSLLGGETWRDLMKLKAEWVREFLGMDRLTNLFILGESHLSIDSSHFLTMDEPF